MTFTPSNSTMETNKEAACRVLSLRAAAGGARLILTVEENGEKEELVVLAARFARVPPAARRAGEIDAKTLAVLRHEAALSGAVEAGMRSLGAVAASEKHLAEKLVAKGFSRDIAREAAGELTAIGYIDERESALALVERDLAKGWGDRRILGDLSAKGYQKEAIEAALTRLSATDARARCRAAALRYPPAETPADARRLAAALTRLGYAGDEIRAALSSLAQE